MNPHSEYIFVRSIDEVDPKKLTIRDLNKKFIDQEGRKYAIKFDLETRQIKFVRLAGSYQEALKIKQEIQKEKFIEKKEKLEFQLPEKREEPTSTKISNFQENKNMDFDFYSPDENFIDENEFFKELERDTKKSVESLRAIEKNLNRSQVFEKLSNSLNDFFDLQKEIEVKCYHSSEEAFKIFKELVYFPRPVSYYISRLSEPVRKKIEKFDEQQQFDYIKRFEIYKIFRELIMNVIDLTNQLEKFYYKLPAIERERKPLVDLISSFAEIKETTQELIQKLNRWYSQYQKI
jgi:hypothetical protein